MLKLDLTTNPYSYDQAPLINATEDICAFIPLIEKRKTIKKQVIKNSYNINKRIIKCVRRLTFSSTTQDQVIFLVHRVLEQNKLSLKKLEAIVATALYLTYRQNKSQILLSQILEVFPMKSGDISKCLSIFKELGLYQAPETYSPWPIYTQLVDHWLPYTSTSIKDFTFSLSFEFAIDPTKANQKLVEEQRVGSMRERMLELGKKIIEFPELILARQGKLPQTLAGGVFVILSKYCKVQIDVKEVARRLGISVSAIRQRKHLVLEVLASKAGAKKEDEDKYNKAIELIKRLI